MKDILGYAGKTVVVTGAATGMGNAAARQLVALDAVVHTVDVAPVDIEGVGYVRADLGDPTSIAAAAEQMPERIDRLFNCAGVPGPPRFDELRTTLINFVGLRDLTEALLPRIVEGGAVASITSAAGMGYKANLERIMELLDTPDFASAAAWVEAHPELNNGYLFSKQCITAYTKRRAFELVERRIRMNCISPSPTDTPMLVDFHAQVGREFLEEHYLSPVGRNATPQEQADPLILLNSDAARFVSGQNLFVDFGYAGAVDVGLQEALGLV
jgi:NAD(P)-dependent dehydrogenase (short-subunit alcohol dehydrogenase family)